MEEALRHADVAVWMVVGAVRPDETRIDHDNVREGAVRRVFEVAVDRRDAIEHAVAPQREEREVGVVVARRNARALETIPDRLAAVDADIELRRLFLVPERRGRVHVLPVRERAREQ